MTAILPSGRPAVGLVAALVCLLAGAAPARAGVIFGLTTGLGGGYRWDAAPRNVSGVGERSLNGGLRYSVQGGSFQAYRDQFTWNVVPTVPEFTAAVQQAFAAWEAPDPVTGLSTAVRFTPDLGTAVAGSGTNSANSNGAEIDLLAATQLNNFWAAGNSSTQGASFFNTIGSTVRLTSGTNNYAGSQAIVGADIIINSNPGAVYTLDLFRRLLTHEIGHALGLGDVEGDISPNRFIDDNYSGSNPTATLTNSWALLVNPLNPAASAGLQRYTVPDSATGTQADGVDILMESRGLGIGPTNPMDAPVPLTNDDFGTRQFLYPTVPVPEPTVPLLAAALAAVIGRRLRRTVG